MENEKHEVSVQDIFISIQNFLTENKIGFEIEKSKVQHGNLNVDLKINGQTHRLTIMPADEYYDHQGNFTLDDLKKEIKYLN